jgi:hypothetical protein
MAGLERIDRQQSGQERSYEIPNRAPRSGQLRVPVGS